MIASQTGQNNIRSKYLTPSNYPLVRRHHTIHTDMASPPLFRRKPPFTTLQIRRGSNHVCTTMRDASNRLWVRETSDSRSSASSLVITHFTLASCAIGFRNIPNVPLTGNRPILHSVGNIELLSAAGVFIVNLFLPPSDARQRVLVRTVINGVLRVRATTPPLLDPGSSPG